MTDNGVTLSPSTEPTPGAMCGYRGCDKAADETFVLEGGEGFRKGYHSCSDHVTALLNQLMTSSKPGLESMIAGWPTFQAPTALNILDPDFTAVGGDVVAVKHGALIDNDDPRWLEVQQHVQRHGLEQELRQDVDDPRFNTGRAVAWLFMTQAARAASSDESIEKLKREICEW